VAIPFQGSEVAEIGRSVKHIAPQQKLRFIPFSDGHEIEKTGAQGIILTLSLFDIWSFAVSAPGVSKTAYSGQSRSKIAPRSF
jgi:hypothetical protein